MSNDDKKELYKFGYNPIDTQDKRRNVLRKAIVIYGPKDLIKKLNIIYKENKNINNDAYIAICGDKKWLQNNYIKIKKKVKKSIRSKRSKRSKRKNK